MPRRPLKLFLATLAPVCVLLAGAVPAHGAATTYNVNTNADGIADACTTSAGGCKLRDAITDSNNNSGTDTITFSAGLGAISLTASGQLEIRDSVNINGNGVSSTIVEPGSGFPASHILFKVIDNTTPLTVSIQDLTARNLTQGGSAAIQFSVSVAGATMNITRVAVTGNTTTGGSGGGIAMSGDSTSTLNVTDSTIAGNNANAGTRSGGIDVSQVAANIVRSTIANNQALEGGGLSIENPGGALGAVSIQNSTISTNTATGSGGGIYDFSASAKLSYNTITLNTSGTGSGQAAVQRVGNSGMTLKGNIISGNLGGPECGFPTNKPTTEGFNFDSGTSCKLNISQNANDHPSTPVTLGPLQNNGGPTFTHALSPPNPAIDAGGLGGCTVSGGATLGTDQRNVLRPKGPACDSGSFEFDPSAASAATGAGGAGAGGGGAAGTDNPPVFASASASPGTFAVDSKGTAEKPVGAARVAKGTTFRYVLSEAARVVFTIQRKSKGRRVKRKCVKPTRRNRKRKRCTRYKTAGRFAVQSVAGSNSHKFSGRIGRKSLSPGRYRAVLVATDAGGKKSKPKVVNLRVVRAR